MKQEQPKKDDTNLQEQKHEKTPFHTIRLRYLKAKKYDKSDSKPNQSES
jgi:hypothetical protein